MPTPACPSPPLDPGTAARAADSDGEPVVEEPRPLQTSEAAPWTEGDAGLEGALPFAGTELAKTACPRLVVTPAVAPRTRAANCEAGVLTTDPPVTAPLRPVARPPVRAPLVCCDDRLAPEVEPLATELLLPEAVDPLELAVVPLALEAELGAGAAAEAPPLGAAALPPPGGGFGDADDGAVPDAGIPVSGAVQAHARLTPTTAVASAASTANENRRTRGCTRNRLISQSRWHRRPRASRISHLAGRHYHNPSPLPKAANRPRLRGSQYAVNGDFCAW
jgi:hypothetical protein